MTTSRQKAFEQLRTPCVELSSAALKYKGHQGSIKDVSTTLKRVRSVLSDLAARNALDEKLAEYAFFPLTHIFNESKRLSSSCLEDAISCVEILVSKGWRQHIAPAMGKQLLILMSLIAGGKPSNEETSVPDELKVVAFDCISSIVQQLKASEAGAEIFRDPGSKNVIDQLAYMLLDSFTDNVSDQMQSAAARALYQSLSAVHDRVILASLLPRTASSLTHVLRSKARHTRKVLIACLDALTYILAIVLADKVTYVNDKVSVPDGIEDRPPEDVLDESWLRATSAQVKIVLVQVMKVRSHESQDVLNALSKLCFMVVEDCPRSLHDALPVVLDTLVFVAQREEGQDTMRRLLRLCSSTAEIDEMLKTKLYDFCQSFPRVMLMNNEQAKQELLGQIEALIKITSEQEQLSDNALFTLTRSLREGLEALHRFSNRKYDQVQAVGTDVISNHDMMKARGSTEFHKLLMAHESQRESLNQVQGLLKAVGEIRLSSRMARLLIDQMSQSNDAVGAWLALSCLKTTSDDSNDLDHMLNFDDCSEDISLSRPHLISELYTSLLPVLTDMETIEGNRNWQIIAIAIESTVLQAQQLKLAYRPELIDSLYPILSLLASNNGSLRNYATTGLNLIAEACGYDSTSNMLIANVDYLINAVGLKLNAFDMSPQAPQVLLLMLKLCGARIVPFIDDLVSSMFSALDSFHGYPKLVEVLFKVLKTIVDISKVQPQLVITQNSVESHQETHQPAAPSVDDILEDLRRRKTRKRKHQVEDEDFGPTPHRPWTSSGAKTEDTTATSSDVNSPGDDDEISTPSKKDTESSLRKPHQLLLKIAQSTTPHLSSSSPSVRHLLLDLLNEISPLLATDENTFLPLINAIWPSVVARLFAPFSTSDDTEDSENETIYNIVAAANTVSTLCEKAGGFISSRIEDIFPNLKQLFTRCQGRILAPNRQQTSKNNSALVLASHQVVTSSGRTSQGQILAALIKLLATVLRNVRVTDDIGDEIVEMLFQYSEKSEEVKQALKTFNADEVWLLQIQGSEESRETTK